MRWFVIGVVAVLAGCARSPWDSAASDRFARDSDACRAEVAAAASDVAKDMVAKTCMGHKGHFVLPLQH